MTHPQAHDATPKSQLKAKEYVYLQRTYNTSLSTSAVYICAMLISDQIHYQCISYQHRARTTCAHVCTCSVRPSLHMPPILDSRSSGTHDRYRLLVLRGFVSSILNLILNVILNFGAYIHFFNILIHPNCGTFFLRVAIIIVACARYSLDGLGGIPASSYLSWFSPTLARSRPCASCVTRCTYDSA